MIIKDLHPWNLSPQEAIATQKKLRNLVITEDQFKKISLIAGVDISIANDIARAAVVILNYSDLLPVEQVVTEKKAEFPYIPGLLAFRELPSIIDALARIENEPDVLMVDGQGIAHPRRFGIASHLGLITDKPAIGCAKTRLFGEHKEPDFRKGSYEPLYDGQDIIGAALRTKDNTNVIYVSTGHKVSIKSAISITLNCCRKYRIPEPTRLAHIVASGHSVVSSQKELF